LREIKYLPAGQPELSISQLAFNDIAMALVASLASYSNKKK